MRELLETFDSWQADGVAVGRAVVVRTYGSAPRPPGSVLLYSSDGRIAGSVSGGCVEAAAAEAIDEARRTGEARVVRYGITDEQAWSVGLACGGTIDVLIQPAVPKDVVAAARTPGTVVISELLGEAGSDLPARIVYSTAGGLLGTTNDEGTDSELVTAAEEALLRGTSRVAQVNGREFFLEAFPVKPRLVIVGAVEIARALVTLAGQLGFETVVIDGRPTFASRERFPDADTLFVGWPDEAADQIGLARDDSVAVLSHDAKFDEPAILLALGRGCRYVGAIGSRKTQADRRQRLSEQGVADDELARLRGPIGLDLGGRAPAEIALAIMAEIVAARYGQTGAPLTR